ncbi:DUF2460 domain-containing protein [Candidatus Pacearchaeota archaeon]|nr:DUF2460 domain-containing protein [Candidatus Pacearchaeota archaeon]
MNIVLNTYIEKLHGYPLFPVMEWGTHVSPLGLYEQRNQRWPRPKRHWILPYNVLSQTERNNLLEIFNRARGQYNVFKFTDQYDYTCSFSECVITAVAAQVLFPLVKEYYGAETEAWTENKIRIVPNELYTCVVKSGGVTKVRGTDYTLDDDTGVVDFTLMGAPGAGVEITASYGFYYPVRWTFDDLGGKSHAPGIWDFGDLHIVEVV